MSIGCVSNVASMTWADGRERRVHVAAREGGRRLEHVRRSRRERLRRVHERGAGRQRLDRGR